MHFRYDNRGRLTEATAGQGDETRTISIRYYEEGPSKGYVQAITDALGRTVEYDYDLAGRVVQQTLPDGREIAYGYDANGNVTEEGKGDAHLLFCVKGLLLSGLAALNPVPTAQAVAPLDNSSSADPSETVLFETFYTRDKLGRLTDREPGRRDHDLCLYLRLRRPPE